MDQINEFAKYKVAPPKYWVGQRELPWLPGSRERMIFFYVTLDDPVELPTGVRFYRGGLRSSSEGSIGMSTELGPDYPPLAPFEFAYRFLGGQRRTFQVENFSSTVDSLMKLWAAESTLSPRLRSWARKRLRALRSRSSKNDVIQSYSIIEICFLDPGGVPESYFADPNGIVFDYLSLGLMWLKDIVEGYRIAAYVPIRDASYMNLGPIVVTVEVDVEARVRTPHVGFPLESATRRWPEWAPRITGAELIETTSLWAARVAVGDPLATYGVNMWTARRMCFVETYYEAAIIHCAIAIESLLPTVWLLLQWESGADAAAAVKKLEAASQGRAFFDMMFGWLSSTLGGHWDPASAPEVADWNTKVRTVRNLIAHTGKRVSRVDAEAAIESSRALNRMVTRRLLTRMKAFPRATYLVAAVDGIDDFYKPGTWDKRYCSLREEQTWFPLFSRWVECGRDAQAATASFTAAIDVCTPGCVEHRRPNRS